MCIRDRAVAVGAGRLALGLVGAQLVLLLAHRSRILLWVWTAADAIRAEARVAAGRRPVAQCAFFSRERCSWRSTTWTTSFFTLESPVALMWPVSTCLLYTSDAADDLTRVDLGGRRIIKKKKNNNKHPK